MVYINRPNGYDSKTDVISVAEFIETELTDIDDTPEGQIRKINNFLGNLTDLLVEKGVLTVAEAGELVHQVIEKA